MKKYILLIFAVSFICTAVPTYAFDFSKKTNDTLMKKGSSKSSLGSPLIGDMGGYKIKKKQATTTKKKKKKLWEKIEDGAKSVLGL